MVNEWRVLSLETAIPKTKKLTGGRATHSGPKGYDRLAPRIGANLLLLAGQKGFPLAC